MQKLSREAIIAGGSHWRYICGSCAALLRCSFTVLSVLFAGGRLSMSTYAPRRLSVSVHLPATVRSAIAFTSLAGGNVAAAVIAQRLHVSLLGIFLSPLLVGLVMNIHGAQGSLWKKVGKLCCNCCCLLCWDTCLAVDRQLGRAQQKVDRALFCWWSARRSAKRWSAASGTKSAGIAAVYRRGQPHTVGDRHRH
ncbi:bile acid:sodium symporter [Salmonella enterica subsp. enterica serovar Weltevreden]|nr:bile acid:sodium symporter [Salmonella enterica subsp. enterica serovar Weltevreden]